MNTAQKKLIHNVETIRNKININTNKKINNNRSRTGVARWMLTDQSVKNVETFRHGIIKQL